MMAESLARAELSQDVFAVSVTEVTNPSHIKYILGSLERELNRLLPDSRIIACNHVTEVVVEQLAGHDYSYGGSCTISAGGRESTLTLCDDDMIGKFTVTGPGISTREGIGLFIINNCPPGG
jgi:hypothetical protein